MHSITVELTDTELALLEQMGQQTGRSTGGTVIYALNELRRELQRERRGAQTPVREAALRTWHYLNDLTGKGSFLRVITPGKPLTHIPLDRFLAEATCGS